MANNTTLDPGTGGDVIATDDVTGVKYQRVKLTDGTEDSTTDIRSGNGTAANSLRVTVASDSTGVIAVTDNGGNLSIDDGGNSITVDNGGTFSVQDTQVITDNAGFTDGTSKIFPVGLIFDEVAGTALTENDIGAARMDSKRAAIGVIEDATTRGQRAAVTASNALKVDGSAVTQPVSGSVTVSGTVTANAGSGTLNTSDQNLVTDNAAFTDGTTKLFMTGYILDDTAGTALTENDAAAPRISTNRATVGVIEDGATRARYATVTASNALKTDGSAVTQPVSGTVTANAGSGTFATSDANTIADDSAFTVATSKVMPSGYMADQTSTDSVDEGDIGAARMTLDRKQIVTLGPDAATEGLSFTNYLDLNTTKQALKASAGKLYGWYVYNDGATEIYVKFFNVASASVTVGTTVADLVLAIPAGSAANVEFTMGIAFSTAMTVVATTGATTADTTSPATNQVVANFFYK